LKYVIVMSLTFPLSMASGCAGSTPSAAISPSIYQEVAEARFVVKSQAGWAANLDEFARASAIPELRSVVLPPGVRELRLTAAVSGMIWQPIPLLRLVEWRDSVAGELYFYWVRLRDSTGLERPPGWVRQRQSGCGTVGRTDQWAACRINPRQGISWQAVADSIAALGIWHLPPDSLDERIGSNWTDQAGVTGEFLVGTAYRRVMYYDLDRLSGDDVRQVGAAAELVAGLPRAER
jgi:hypothetical protein